MLSNGACSAQPWNPYPILADHKNVVAYMFRARTTPHMFVLDKKGVLRQIFETIIFRVNTNSGISHDRFGTRGRHHDPLAVAYGIFQGITNMIKLAVTFFVLCLNV